jgi:hypothetical protein
MSVEEEQRDKDQLNDEKNGMAGAEKDDLLHAERGDRDAVASGEEVEEREGVCQ